MRLERTEHMQENLETAAREKTAEGRCRAQQGMTLF